MKDKAYIFWLRSNKGTDSQQVVKFEGKPKRSDIKDKLELWCGAFGAWGHSDNTIEYGWAKASKGNLKKLANYNDKKFERSLKINALTNKSITTKDFSDWLAKNKKKLKFPFV